MATTDDKFVTAEGLAKVMQEVGGGGGVDVLAEAAEGSNGITCNVSGYRFVALIGFVTYGNNGMVSCIISPELIKTVQANIYVGGGFNGRYYFVTSVDVGGNLAGGNVEATILKVIGIK